MRFRTVFQPDNAAPGVGGATFIFWVWEQFVTAQTWFSSLAGWIALLATAFWLGYDLWPYDGRLRQLLRRLFIDFGQFGAVSMKHQVLNLGENHGGAKSATSLTLPFVSSGRHEIEAIRCRAIQYRYLAGSLTNERGQYEWYVSKNKILLDDESFSIPLAVIPDDVGNPGVYGDENIKGYALTDGTAHYITVEIMARKFRKQVKTVQIILPNKSMSNSPAGERDPAKRFVVFEDHHLPKPPKEN